jgi:hypothetical protein
MVVNRGILRIGIKYCGGCNPLYDRVATVKKLEQKLRGKAVFVSTDRKEVDLILAVQGCDRACADLSHFKGTPIQMVLTPEEESRALEHIIGRAPTGSRSSSEPIQLSHVHREIGKKEGNIPPSYSRPLRGR